MTKQDGGVKIKYKKMNWKKGLGFYFLNTKGLGFYFYFFIIKRDWYWVNEDVYGIDQYYNIIVKIDPIII